MPICNKPPPALGNIKSATEIDDHASEAAKVKRTREQAYFNSYNFDAIETLPYDDDEDEDDDGARAANTDAKLAHHSRKSSAHNSRQRLPNASLSSSKSNYSGGSQRSFNAHDVELDYARSQRGDMNYAYLQRLGALFVRTQHATRPEMPTVANANIPHAVDESPTHRSTQVKLQHESADNGNFLLPRAMLKYQSVGSANSMPLAVLSTVHATGQTSNQLLQNASNSHSNSQSSGGGGGSVTKYSGGNVTVLLTNHNNSSVANSANAAAHASSKTRPNYANSNDNYSSLLMVANQDTTKMQTASTTATARIKKQSTSSTATTTASSGSTEHELPPNQSASTHGRSNHLTKTLKQKASTTESERRGRTNSHQSHYSTDKSGSSGYYSSNVCSTYSLEDHIYSEPVIDVLGAKSKSKSAIDGQSQQQQQQQAITATSEMERSARVRAANNAAQGKRYPRHNAIIGGELARGGANVAADDEADDDDGNRKVPATPRTTPELQMTLRHKSTAATHPAAASHFSEHLRILETSIENLDRHLKNFPSLSSQEHIASFVQSHNTYLQQQQQPQPVGVDAAGDKLTRAAQTHLPTIMEGYDAPNQPRAWREDMADDSLLDIDLDSFLLVNERQGSKRDKLSTALHTVRAGDSVGGIDNPNFLTDEQEENHYKCAKYINSCPEDAYRVESDIVAGTGTGTGTGTGSLSGQSVTAVEHYLKRYEDQLHFQSTRELLEDVRDKIRLLSQSNNNGDLRTPRTDNSTAQVQRQLPQELEAMIKTLKLELEMYLERMNRHSELEIRQLCSGLVKNQNIVKMKKAFERRRSTYSLGALDADYGHASAYEAVAHAGVPVSIREQIASIRCASDPNFKMKRKSLTEVFPTADCYAEPKVTQPLATEARPTTRSDRSNASAVRVTVQLPAPPAHNTTQMQRNLSFQQPILNKLDAKVGSTTVTGSAVRIELSQRSACCSGNGSGAESAESGDKDSILEWHRKKPSIWEMYYGTNRMNQTLLGKRNGMVVNNSQPTMSYPSSRPESDFTLDLPRAEQLRIKMEKEKKFRQRCRYITTFLSLVFFLLTVMVVSLVLTRGKRMFGSMI